MNESKKKLTFELSPEQLRIKTLLNKEFLAVDIMAISNIYPNRNKSYFTENSMRNAIPTFYEKPILGSFSVLKDDFGGHDNGLINDEYGVHEDHTGGRYEVPLGLVRSKDRVELIEKDGLKWISLSAALWVNYSYRQVKKLLKSKGKKVSVEVEVTKSHIDNDGIEVIDEFSLMGITILGSDYIEAIPNANISIPELEGTEAYQMRKKSLTFAYQELDKSLGITPESNDNVNIDKSNFSDTPINNEDTDEIKMDNDERGGETVPMYTLNEKRQMLQNVLDNDNLWIVDISETEVYYEIGDEGTFSAPYSIEVGEDGKAVVSVDESAKQPVVRSWKKYDESEAEAEKENFEEKKTDEPEKEKESTENKEVEAEDNKEEESTDKKEKDESAEEKERESCEPEEECKMSEDECKMSEDGCECESKEECAENSDEENKECESASEDECKMSENDECKMSEDECKMSEDDKDDKDDDSDEDKKEEESAESAGAIEKCSEEIPNEPVKEQVVFTVGDKTYTEDEFKAEFIKMSEIIADYEAKFTATKNAEIYSFVCSVIDSEEDLTAENKDIIKNAMKENCDKSSYSANETAQEAAEHLIADALYQQKKMAKSSKVEKDFSVSIIKETSTVVANTAKNSMEDLKNAIANLNKI